MTMLNRQSLKIGLVILTCLVGQACQNATVNNPFNLEFDSSKLDEKPSFTVTNVHKTWLIADEGVGPSIELAKDYAENGQGDMLLLVTYEAVASAKQDKLNRNAATQDAQKIDSVLKANGVSNAKVRVAPVGRDKAGMAIISYDAVLLAQPMDCMNQPFADIDTTMANGDKYKFGCERTRLMSQMVAHKKDMLGNTQMGATQSAPLGKSMEEYNSGEAVGQDNMNITTSEIGQ